MNAEEFWASQPKPLLYQGIESTLCTCTEEWKQTTCVGEYRGLQHLHSLRDQGKLEAGNVVAF